MADKKHSRLRYPFVLLLLLLVSCQTPPELASEFPNYTLLTMEELGADVRLSFLGPGLETSQLIGEEARADKSLFVLLEPQPLRTARTVSNLDGGLVDRGVFRCPKPCARILKFSDKDIWVKGEVCKKGAVATFSNLDVPTRNVNQRRVYEASGLSFPGLPDLDPVFCYEAYFFHEGEVICQQSCVQCGVGEFDCIFYSPSLGFLPIEMPEGSASSVFEIDCNRSDLNQCGGAPPGDGGIVFPP